MSKFLNTLAGALKKVLPVQIAAFPFFAMTGIPTDPWRVRFIEGIPEGLKHLYTASSPAEAEMWRQLLIQEGFHIEYVSSTGTGVFGMTGNSAIYVHADEYERAAAFLKEQFK